MKTMLAVFLGISAIAMAVYFWYERFGKGGKKSACCAECVDGDPGLKTSARMGGKKAMT